MPIMPFREKMKRVFSRSGSGSHSASSSPLTSKDPKNSPNSGYWPKQTRNPNKGSGIRVPIVKPGKIKYRANGKPKIELYKSHEVPRSKYRGPFDEAHIQRLAAYSIPNAMLASNRPRSMLSEFSPMGTRALPSRRGSVVSDEEVIQYINGTVGAAHQRYPLMNLDHASDSELISPSAVPTTTTTLFDQSDLLNGGRNISHSTRAPILHPGDGNLSSSTLLTFQTQDTLTSGSGTVPAASTTHLISVSEPDKAAVSPSMSRPVSSEQLSSALNAIKLRS
ncbi:hypothetical protein AJ78_04049 [Emergomyces pasteurianus Ep9510]|uniref:Uncharacterized protein n=1 Tax=Emergomyces pasteurianus Ep9510 TaxID=1447872 RepID=A0A1J9PII3_9EURO|nr:hypothetical protein AJ78_04049 [Emergomyces pasteurianus Ep9510]